MKAARKSKQRKQRAAHARVRARRPATKRKVLRKKPPQSVRGTLLYLYGVSRAGGARINAISVDGRSAVEQLPSAGLVCWVSRVDAREYGEQLERNMEDLEWLAEAGVRHQRAVAEIAAGQTILPARFGTVFLSERSLAADLAARRSGLLAAFARVAGADEWGVKVFAGAPPPVPAARAASGRDYLKQKGAMLRRPKRKLADEVVRFAEALSAIAVDATGGGKVSSGQRDLEWQASFLVRRADQRRLQALLRKFARAWGDARRIECSGPWPPYSFVAGHER